MENGAPRYRFQIRLIGDKLPCSSGSVCFRFHQLFCGSSLIRVARWFVVIFLERKENLARFGIPLFLY